MVGSVSTLQGLPVADSVATEPLLTVRDLKVDVPAGGGRWLTAVEDVSFSVGRGETVGLIGESGSGKPSRLDGHDGPGARCPVRAYQVKSGGIDFAGQRPLPSVTGAIGSKCAAATLAHDFPRAHDRSSTRPDAWPSRSRDVSCNTSA